MKKSNIHNCKNFKCTYICINTSFCPVYMSIQMCIYTYTYSHTYWLRIFIVLIRDYREKWDRKERELKHVVHKRSLVSSKSLTLVLRQLFPYSAHTSCSPNKEVLRLICSAPAKSFVNCVVPHDFCLSATWVLTTCTPYQSTEEFLGR